MPTPYHRQCITFESHPKKPLYLDLVDLVEECVRYGSHVMEWTRTEPTLTKEERVIFLALLRHSIELVDAIPDNIRKGQIDGNKGLLRALLDSCFSILYFLQGDSSKLARAFMYMDDRATLSRLKRISIGTSEHDDFMDAHEGDRLLRREILVIS